MKSKKVAKKKKPVAKQTTSKRPGKKFIVPIVQHLSAVEATEIWLGENADLFNVTRLETLALLPASSLRQVVAGKRKLSHVQYQRLKDNLLPKLLQGAVRLIGDASRE